MLVMKRSKTAIHIEEKGAEVELAFILGNTRPFHKQPAEAVDRFIIGVHPVVGKA